MNFGLIHGIIMIFYYPQSMSLVQKEINLCKSNKVLLKDILTVFFIIRMLQQKQHKIHHAFYYKVRNQALFAPLPEKECSKYCLSFPTTLNFEIKDIATQRRKPFPVIEERKKKPKQNRQKGVDAICVGHWTFEENQRYHKFLENHHQLFVDREKRKQNQIFKMMAKTIQTRKPEQCRSHHQKLEKKYKTTFKILKFLGMKLQGDLKDDEIMMNLSSNDPLPSEGSESQLACGQNHLQDASVKKDQEYPTINELSRNILDDDYERDLDFKLFS